MRICCIRGGDGLENFNNSVVLAGTLGGRPEYSHAGKDENYYVFPLEVERLSGTIDTLNILLGEELLRETEIKTGDKVYVSGEVRSYNNKSGVGNKLVISVLARDVFITDCDDENSVMVCGTVCKQPNFRRTPMGRQICDLMIAVNRRYGRSDYLPCIVWGSLAERASLLETGDEVEITGRLQSRRYIKNLDDRVLEKTAYEISAVNMKAL